jgi:hypothetical protein
LLKQGLGISFRLLKIEKQNLEHTMAFYHENGSYFPFLLSFIKNFREPVKLPYVMDV